MKADFSGWATKYNLLCSDGRTIGTNAFAHQDGKRVPLVWQHRRDDPEYVVGHGILEHRDGEGMYVYGYLNESPKGVTTRELLKHGDVESLSISAGRIKEKFANVIHGFIQEVSVVLAGANIGALIEDVAFAHDDSGEGLCVEIYTGLEIEHESPPEDSEGEEDTRTVGDVLETLNEEQREAVFAILAEAVGEIDDEDDSDGKVEQSDDDTLEHEDTNKERGDMARNVFEGDARPTAGKHLTHEQISTIFADARKEGSLRDTVLDHAGTYGIDDINLLFPDAREINNTPEFLKRRTEWVAQILGGIRHSPFSKVKMTWADITEEEARAKGYVTGHLKTEEVFKLFKRSVSPTTVYKKQKLDRDDILDITSFDVVAWVKGEMRLMLDEELASAFIFGDGRSNVSPDKIDSEKIIPIAEEHELFAPRVLATEQFNVNTFIDGVTNAMANFEGSGTPVAIISQSNMTKILVQRNAFGERVYKSMGDVAAEAGVSGFIVVPDVIFARAAAHIVGAGGSAVTYNLVAIVVTLQDYTAGADKGGEVSFFDDFDIDYNQQKYLLETRCSGALTKAKSAIRIYSTSGTIVANPANPLVLVGQGGDPENP